MYSLGEVAKLKSLSIVDIDKITQKLRGKKWLRNILPLIYYAWGVDDYQKVSYLAKMYREGVTSGDIEPYQNDKNYVVVQSMATIMGDSDSVELKKSISNFFDAFRELVENQEIQSSKLYIDAYKVEEEFKKDNKLNFDYLKDPLDEMNKTVKVLSITGAVIGIAYIIGKLK